MGRVRGGTDSDAGGGDCNVRPPPRGVDSHLGPSSHHAGGSARERSGERRWDEAMSSRGDVSFLGPRTTITNT